MNSRRTRKFVELLDSLPEKEREQADAAYELWKSNPQHPSLRFKKVHTSAEVWSVRINRDVRALCTIIDGNAIWFWIGSHAAYEQMLKQL